MSPRTEPVDTPSVADPRPGAEVEVLSPYSVGASLDPTDLRVPVSTRVRRPPSLRSYRQLRALGMVGGAVLVVLLGMALGILAVVASGLRSV